MEKQIAFGDPDTFNSNPAIVFQIELCKMRQRKLSESGLIPLDKGRKRKRTIDIQKTPKTFNLRAVHCEKCPNTEIFLVRIFLYSVRIQENADQKNSVLGLFSRSGVQGDIVKNEVRF